MIVNTPPLLYTTTSILENGLGFRTPNFTLICKLMDYFKNKVIVITGASSGLGRASAIYFSRQGSRIALIARREDKLSETLSLMEHPKKHLVLQADLCQPDHIQRLSSQICSTFEQTDILINNAANWAAGPLDSVTDLHVQQIITTILTGNLLMTKHLLDHLRKASDPQILNIVSTAGLTTNPISFTSGSVAYHAAKWGQAGFSEALRDELKNQVRVMSLYPGAFDQRSTYDDEENLHPHHRKGILGVKDVIDAMVFCLTRPPYVSIDSLVVAPKKR